MNESKVTFYRTLNEAQEKRIKHDHQATVLVDSNGELQYLSEEIITPKGLVKENKLISVVPTQDEKVTTIGEASYLFSDLAHMNIILTNACNLKCSYCYEQHNKDFGRFTEESLLKAYNFLLNNSQKEYKTFQFFGGEPLIHKDLILSFLEKNKDHLSYHAQNLEQKQVVSMITNGILLSPDFIQRYFSYDFTWMLISLDTLDAEVDHRELKQEQIDKILESIKLIPEEAKQRVWMRNTISKETVHGLKDYIDTVYGLGIRNIIIHPLTLDSTVGFISWNDQEWGLLRQTLIDAINNYHDLEISFSEGVGKKGENNCMIGSDMVAIDGSGDFSGCYFFTNQKSNGTAHTILGNVFNDTVYVDRYVTFQKEFMKMFEEEEQCKTCDYKQRCYQCPAGNLDTGPRMFRPDDMCQKIVKLYVDLQDDILRKQFAIKYQRTMDFVAEQGEDEYFTTNGFYNMYVMLTGKHAPINNSLIPKLPSRELFALWKKLVENKYKFNGMSFEQFIKELPYNNTEQISVKELYEFLLEYLGLPTEKSHNVKELTQEVRVGYFVLLQILAINNKNLTFIEQMLGNE